MRPLCGRDFLYDHGCHLRQVNVSSLQLQWLLPGSAALSGAHLKDADPLVAQSCEVALATIEYWKSWEASKSRPIAYICLYSLYKATYGHSLRYMICILMYFRPYRWAI